MTPELVGVRFLITHTLVQDIMGSTVMVLELAEYLQASGADVVVHAAHAGPPLSDEFAARGIRVVIDPDELAPDDFDYVWVNSQVLPPNFLEHGGGIRPVFIFNHMSASPLAPDEHPYIYELEQHMASLSVSVSEETRRRLRAYFDEPPPDALYPNPAPMGFCELERSHAGRPSRFLMVSNHHCPELDDARELLLAAGCHVERWGRGREEYALLTPQALTRFDAVISIGKTVQYCLVSSTPIFVYDHFGGFGYLSQENYEVARRRNFSGRGGLRLDGERIAHDLIYDYERAVGYQLAHRPAFIEQFAINDVVARVLAQVTPREVVLPQALRSASWSAETFGARAYRWWGELDQAQRRIAQLAGENQHLRDQLDAVLASRSFRLGYGAMRRLDAMRKRLDAWR